MTALAWSGVSIVAKASAHQRQGNPGVSAKDREPQPRIRLQQSVNGDAKLVCRITRPSRSSVHSLMAQLSTAHHQEPHSALPRPLPAH